MIYNIFFIDNYYNNLIFSRLLNVLYFPYKKLKLIYFGLVSVKNTF